MRAKLDTETSIWERLRPGVAKDAMWVLVGRSLVKLKELEDAERRRRRRADLLFGAFASLLFAVNAAWSCRTGGTASAISTSIVLVPGLVVTLRRDRLEHRHTAAAHDGR